MRLSGSRSSNCFCTNDCLATYYAGNQQYDGRWLSVTQVVRIGVLMPIFICYKIVESLHMVAPSRSHEVATTTQYNDISNLAPLLSPMKEHHRSTCDPRYTSPSTASNTTPLWLHGSINGPRCEQLFLNNAVHTEVIMHIENAFVCPLRNRLLVMVRTGGN